MKKEREILLFSILLVAGIITFTLQIFVFEAPDGTFGFVLCLTSILMILLSFIKLCQSSEKIKEVLLALLDFLFSL